MHLIFYLIENGILQIQQFLEMFRNQSKHRSNRTLIFSPESSIRGQSSQLQLKYNQPIDFVPIQKTRTFSHKKLTLTSAIPSPLLNISNEVIKKPAQPTFQVNKFYRPPIKGNPLLQSKKISTEDNKISLKVSNVDNWQVSPERTNQMSRIQSQTQIQIDKQNSIRCQIVQLIQSRFQTFLTEINSQANQINELKRKIGFLENEINAKTQKLNNLMSERLYESKKTYQNSRQQQMVGKVRDLQIEINKITWQSNKGQINVNMKLDELTNKIVKMEISKEQTQKNKLKVGLDQLVLKLNSWLNDQQKRIVKAESSLSTESILKLEQINQTFRLLSYKIQKLQEDLSNRKTESEKIMQTKDSINYWQSFEDFVISNHSHSQMPNNSIFGSDDYFFHPDSNLSFMRLKSSALCNKLRLSSTMNTNVQDASIASQESAANSFDNLVTMMEELRSKYNKELPLECSLDKHRRIVIKQTGKLLKNEKQNSYFKISEEERRILVQRGYLKTQQ